MNDFSRTTLRKLARKGISLMSTQAIPDMSSSMPYANATRGYVMNDNGCCRVWSFAQVMAAAA
jgi:hypothetical protein